MRDPASQRVAARISAGLIAAIAIVGCSTDPVDDALGEEASAVTTEDGLAEAYREYRQLVGTVSLSLPVGHHPGLSTSKVTANGEVVMGFIDFRLDTGIVEATLINVPDEDDFDLWFVDNVERPGLTVKPEDGDVLRKIGSYTGDANNFKFLAVDLGLEDVRFDLDMAVVTPRDGSPTYDIVATGARTLFEKRLLRELDGRTLDPVPGPRSNQVETTDPLVQRGAQLFFQETFGGNGRTCGTCHPAENNLTIDTAFVATRPPTDPLFVAERVPALAGLEDSVLLRRLALIRENVDGFEDPTVKFVMRGTPHTLAMSTSLGFVGEQLTGWGGDGAPGRGSLNEFAFGAVFQHFPRTLNRVAGVDFRIPTQAELDALEAFQLFSGRQRNPNTLSMTFAVAAAETGKQLFFNEGACANCHSDLFGSSLNLRINTGVEGLSRELGLPIDGGFGSSTLDGQTFGDGSFNVPPLVEAADTAPFFHNGLVATLEDSIAFYQSQLFLDSPGTGFGIPQLDPQRIRDIGAFLRVVNALENVRQTRKRTAFVRDHRASGNTAILGVALADCDDAIAVLTETGLAPAAVHALRTARQTLAIGRANPDSARRAFMTSALTWLGIARSSLVTSNPNNEL